jgi:hypothetical protein
MLEYRQQMFSHWLAMEHHGGVLEEAATQEYPTTRDP